MPTTSIASTLGAGSGIDVASLVTSLVAAQFTPRNAQLQTKTDAITAQISGVSSLKSAVGDFSAALRSLVKGGTLAASPTSSNLGTARITPLTGQTVGALAATLDVLQLAKPQSAASDPIPDRAAAIGAGSFTLTFGSATVADGHMTGFTAGGGTPVTIAIDSDHTSLDGIAAAINAAAAGISASIVSDTGGARLVLKGATGASQAFTLASGDAGLSDLTVGVGAARSSIGSVAQDAIVKLDGIEVHRAGNSISNLIDKAKLELTGTGTTTLGVSEPTAAIGQAVSDFVDTYNQLLTLLKAQTDPKTGALRNDPAARALQTALARLPSTVLTGGDGSAPRTLAELGVGTNRDGSLRLDSGRLSTALATYPDAVAAMFADGAGASGHGLAGALAAIADAATSTTVGLGASATKYDKAKTELADQQAKASDDASALRDRLTLQFTTMDARVAAYKSTQNFLKNQIDAWNNSNNN